MYIIPFTLTNCINLHFLINYFQVYYTPYHFLIFPPLAVNKFDTINLKYRICIIVLNLSFLFRIYSIHNRR